MLSKKLLNVIYAGGIWLIGLFLGMHMAKPKTADNSNKIISDKKVEKFRNYYGITTYWIQHKQDGKEFASYFRNYGYKKIAIYGFGGLGKLFYNELKNTEIEVLYAIDTAADSMYAPVKIIEVEQKLENVDVIVVTATFAFSEIKNNLSKRTDIKIISLEEIINSLID